MRFSQSGLFIERYVKCRNCGVLIYEGDGLAGLEEEFCSSWCAEWSNLRAHGDVQIRLRFSCAEQK